MFLHKLLYGFAVQINIENTDKLKLTVVNGFVYNISFLFKLI